MPSRCEKIETNEGFENFFYIKGKTLGMFPLKLDLTNLIDPETEAPFLNGTKFQAIIDILQTNCAKRINCALKVLVNAILRFFRVSFPGRIPDTTVRDFASMMTTENQKIFFFSLSLSLSLSLIRKLSL